MASKDAILIDFSSNFVLNIFWQSIRHRSR